jgi:lysophospholipase L1-like esterase
MVGTNNLGGGETPAATAEGIGRIVDTIKAVSPGSKILLLGVLPRGFSPTAPYRGEIDQLNSLISLLAHGQRVKYLNIGGAFVNADGWISQAVMADALHPTAYGYELWTAAMWPTLLQLLTGQ